MTKRPVPADPLCDAQSSPDTRGLSVDQVGVCDLRYPIVVWDRAKRRQQTVATLSLSVVLPHRFKGTHMSRFLQVLNRHRGEVTMRTMPALLGDLKRDLTAESARVEARFPYMIEKAAPVSGETGLLDYDCAFTGIVEGDAHDFLLQVKVPVTSVCPCSKSVSDYGAHNQRGTVSLEIRTRRDAKGKARLVWIEELVEIAEASASSPVYPVLKRRDERHVTMRAFDNPVFVEDIARNVAVALLADPRIAWFRVRAVNEESIHNHAAYAVIERTVDPAPGPASPPSRPARPAPRRAAPRRKTRPGPNF